MRKTLSPADSDRCYHFGRIVTENLSTVDTDMIMEKLAMKPKALQNFTKRVSGLPPKALIQHYKMEHAAHMLRSTNRTVTDIANQCGYYDNSYFSRVFMRTYGMSPGAYRKGFEKGRPSQPAATEEPDDED